MSQNKEGNETPLQPFKDGDVVRLKSGGPRMTVVAKSASMGYRCAWFVDGEYRIADITGGAIELAGSADE